MSTAVPLLPLHALVPSTGTTLPLNPHISNVSAHTLTMVGRRGYNLYRRAQASGDDKHLTLLLYIHEVLGSKLV